MLPAEKVKENPDSLIRHNNITLISTAIIYGRNASGKSNLFKAILALQLMVLYSSDNKVDEKIKEYRPFKLDRNNSSLPVEFSIEFIAPDGLRYSYEIQFTGKEILKENLYFFPKNQRAKLFERKFGNPISFGNHVKGRKKDIEELLYSNQLLLSKIMKDKLEALIPPLNFFRYKMFLPETVKIGNDVFISHFSKLLGKDSKPKLAKNLNKLLRFADTGIQSLNISERKKSDFKVPEEVPEDVKENFYENFRFRIDTQHTVYENSMEVGKSLFNIKEESDGTQKLLAVGGCIIEALMDGQVILIDEFDQSLHPQLTQALIKLFHSKELNPNNAQLVVTSHDVSLLNSECFRRDQIWFAEKEFQGNSYYYSISNIKGIRANIPYEHWYLKGKFGATPVFNYLELDLEL